MDNIWDYEITPETQRRLEDSMLAYSRDMRKTHKVSNAVLEGWAHRYYVSMLEVLRRQHKR